MRPSAAIASSRSSSIVSNVGTFRPSVPNPRNGHSADRTLHRPLQRRREARGAAAVHRRRIFCRGLVDGATEVKYTVVFTAAYPPIARQILAGEFDVIEHPTEPERTEDDVITILSEADAAITLLSDPLTRRVLTSNPNLRMIANHAVGYNNIDIDAARELGIRVTNTPGVLTEATADFTIALILAITR